MKCLLIGGSHDGNRVEVPAHLGRIHRQHKFNPGQTEVYDAVTLGTPGHQYTVFIFHDLSVHEAMELLIEKYPTPRF